MSTGNETGQGESERGEPELGESERGTTAAHDVIGPDRSVEVVVADLLSGTNAIVAGMLGSGKSHFTRAIVAALRERGSDPVVVRAGLPLSRTAFGAFDATGDPRLAVLRARDAHGGAGDGSEESEPEAAGGALIVVIDDAQALDESAFGLVGRACYDGRMTVLLSLAVDRDSDRTASADSAPVMRAITQLWLAGGANRYDLHQFDAATASELMQVFAGGRRLDTATTAALFARSCGSRMLLRELTLDAVAQLDAGHDPLDPLHEVHSGSRSSDAVASALGEYSADERLALAMIGRLPGIEYAEACRTIEPSTIGALMLGRAVHTGHTPARQLFANRLLAREAERRLEPGALDRALDEAMRRALTTPGMTAGVALNRLIAANWLSMRPTVPGPATVDADTRCRILASAAHRANDEAQPDLALAFSRLGDESGRCADLTLEASRALAGLRRFDLAREELEKLDLATMRIDQLRRGVRWWGSLSTWMPTPSRAAGEEPAPAAGSASAREWLAASAVDDPSVLAEIEVERLEQEILEMRWESALSLADSILAGGAAHPLARLRAALAAAVASTMLIGWHESLPRYRVADAFTRDPVTGETVNPTLGLSVLCAESFLAMIGGFAPGGHRDRLHRLLVVAAEQDDRTALSLGGIVAGVVALATEDTERASIEFDAALRRFDRLEFAAWRPMIGYLRAIALARLGRASAAREVVADIDDHLMADYPVFAFARDRALAALAVALATGPAAGTAVIAAGSSAAWRPGEPGAAAHTGGNALTDELTDREHEVARLVAQGLSNKEIAQRLFLSVRTVESHVYTARGKTGSTSRRELGRLVAETGGRG
ncbi:LuxR C-terminal-related transcriptional regulator [Herbiconiux sp. 11R-BC]|uniref:helix-turn-helix transcriptional regulator n=1 Tax=Herbiconiux sp. 11R-BC TaxID=3111637 RepID=UPI003C0E1A45